MESKYYTPTIEEFHVGFEYEYYEQCLFDLPDKKQITSNVRITVEWDNGGGTQQFYGYLSYSSRLVLTDGIEKQNGINEVWITY